MRAEAEQNALLIPEINDCCNIGGPGQFDLQVNFGGADVRWEGCATVVVETLLFYPTDGESGTATVCVDLPAPNPQEGHFSIFDPGEFTESVLPGGGIQVCTEVEYPVEGFLDADPGFVKKRFYVIPELAVPTANPNVSLSASVNVEGEDCACPFGIDFAFNTVTSPFVPGVGAYFIEEGADISELLEQPCPFNCLPPGSGDFNNGRVLIFGELNIDEDYTFGESNDPIRANITLGPGSKINVKDGATFTLIDTEVTGCFEMWEAINVEAGGELVVKPGRRPSSISGGEFGVRVHDGGRAELDNVLFEANYRSVTTPDDGQEKVPDINVLGCDFLFGEGPDLERTIPTPFLNQPYFGVAPRAGVELYDVAGGLVTDRGLTINSTNTYENLENGIIFNRSSALVTDSRFRFIKWNKDRESGNGILVKEEENAQVSSDYNYITVDGNTQGATPQVGFEYTRTGIRSDNGHGLNVFGSAFTEVRTGLAALRSGRIRFFNNTVRSDREGIRIDGRRRVSYFFAKDNVFYAGPSEDVASQTAAIFVNSPDLANSSERYRFTDNIINLEGAEFGLFANNARQLTFSDNEIIWGDDSESSTGVQFDGGYRNSVKGNYFIGNEDALRNARGVSFDMVDRSVVSCNTVEDIATSMLFVTNNQGSKIRGNVIKNAVTGLQVGNGTGAFHTVGRQVHQANRWLGSFEEAGAVYSGSPDNINFSQFIVDNTDGGGFLPTNWLPFGSSFIDDRPNDPFPFFDNCPGGTPPGDNFGGKDPYADLIIKGQMDWSGSLGAERWIAETRLYNQWADGELSAAIYPELGVWLNSDKTNKIQAVMTANTLVANINAGAEPDFTTVEEATDQFIKAQQDYRQASIALLREEGEDPNQLITAREASRSALIVRRTDLNALLVPSTSSSYATDLFAARSANSAISGGATHVRNQVKINDYLIDLAENGLNALDDELEEIIFIADQCPSVGGGSVFQARSLVSMLGVDRYYDDDLACTTSNEHKQKSQQVGNEFTVSPNPATDVVSVRFDQEVETTVVIRNSLGTTLRTQQAIAAKGGKQGTLSINVSDLSNGIYYLSIYQSGEKIKTSKLIVSHQY